MKKEKINSGTKDSGSIKLKKINREFHQTVTCRFAFMILKKYIL